MKPSQDQETIGSFFSEVQHFLSEIARVPLDKERETQRHYLEKQLYQFRSTNRLLPKAVVFPMSKQTNSARNTFSIKGFTRTRRSSYPCNKLGFSPLPKLKEEDDEQEKMNKDGDNRKTMPKQKQELKIPKMYVLNSTKSSKQVDFQKFIENGVRVPVAGGGRIRANTFPLANIEVEKKADELAAQCECPRRRPDSSYIRLVSSLGLNANCTVDFISSEVQSPKNMGRETGCHIMPNAS